MGSYPPCCPALGGVVVSIEAEPHSLTGLCRQGNPDLECKLKKRLALLKQLSFHVSMVDNAGLLMQLYEEERLD
jgi:hypothetical protein